ncbi:DHHC zinc finger protein (macronuclear) [Tetrahymena thermophila SB210]|uniref:protein S-acyltransferase n=1 Tax=Tetrahymena thermophila (strain SB210) TaxID=312017 RepID=Q23JH7_TETTS|nr:DHHC zinc finger protein [Tetrahymena thermophila SB210]EAR96667.2 DHHC zinc finger protein [Tetrahymena thermophila SB210]|eukprot:XP_001016912.2 DHHC zinc finger protein [Tetrahymena thermophila SB210]
MNEFQVFQFKKKQIEVNENTLYKDIWSSNSRIYLKGLLILGSEPKNFLFSFAFFNCCCFVFYFCVLNFQKEPNFAQILITLILHLFCDYLLFKASTTDPGIIPKNVYCCSTDKELLDIPQIPSSGVGSNKIIASNLAIQTSYLRIKICRTCGVHRPPRSMHCAFCNNCVENFDHHCPWLGTCIGKRNYKYFFGFITFLLMMIINFIVSCFIYYDLQISEIKGKDETASLNYAFTKSLKSNPIPLILGIVALIAVWFILALWLYHVNLCILNSTTTERLKKIYLSFHNPFQIQNLLKYYIKCLVRGTIKSKLSPMASVYSQISTTEYSKMAQSHKFIGKKFIMPLKKDSEEDVKENDKSKSVKLQPEDELQYQEHERSKVMCRSEYDQPNQQSQYQNSQKRYSQIIRINSNPAIHQTDQSQKSIAQIGNQEKKSQPSTSNIHKEEGNSAMSSIKPPSPKKTKSIFKYSPNAKSGNLNPEFQKEDENQNQNLNLSNRRLQDLSPNKSNLQIKNEAVPSKITKDSTLNTNESHAFEDFNFDIQNQNLPQNNSMYNIQSEVLPQLTDIPLQKISDFQQNALRNQNEVFDMFDEKEKIPEEIYPNINSNHQFYNNQFQTPSPDQINYKEREEALTKKQIQPFNQNQSHQVQQQQAEFSYSKNVIQSRQISLNEYSFNQLHPKTKNQIDVIQSSKINQGTPIQNQDVYCESNKLQAKGLNLENEFKNLEFSEVQINHDQKEKKSRKEQQPNQKTESFLSSKGGQQKFSLPQYDEIKFESLQNLEVMSKTSDVKQEQVSQQIQKYSKTISLGSSQKQEEKTAFNDNLYSSNNKKASPALHNIGEPFIAYFQSIETNNGGTPQYINSSRKLSPGFHNMASNRFNFSSDQSPLNKKNNQINENIQEVFEVNSQSNQITQKDTQKIQLQIQ